MIASFLYNEKIAKTFHNSKYYISQQDMRKNIVQIDDVKKQLSTSGHRRVDEVIQWATDQAAGKIIPIFVVLHKIKNMPLLNS